MLSSLVRIDVKGIVKGFLLSGRISNYEKAASRKHTQFKTRVQNIIPHLWPKWLKLTPYLWPKRLKNYTLCGRTYLYNPYEGEPGPPNFPHPTENLLLVHAINKWPQAENVLFMATSEHSFLYFVSLFCCISRRLRMGESFCDAPADETLYVNCNFRDLFSMSACIVKGI